MSVSDTTYNLLFFQPDADSRRPISNLNDSVIVDKSDFWNVLNMEVKIINNSPE